MEQFEEDEALICSTCKRPVGIKSKDFPTWAIYVILTLALQTGAFLWWGGSMTSRVDSLERQMQELNSEIRQYMTPTYRGLEKP